MNDDFLPHAATTAGKRVCDGKALYPSKKAALTIINSRTHGHQRNRPKCIRAYYCQPCAAWHLTSLPEYH